MAAQPADEGRLKGAETGRPWAAHGSAGTLVLQLAWGLGDVLLSTSAIRRYRELHPEEHIIYQTYTHNKNRRYALQYAEGYPGEMLMHNPDIDEVLELGSGHPVPARVVRFRYAWFGGPSLDYPIQAHYWENLGLEWEKGQRFDSYYYVTEAEREWARKTLGSHQPILAIAPHGGWPGKHWTDAGWAELIAYALENHLTPVIMEGDALTGAPWDQRGVINLTGQLDMRKNGALLELADFAVMIEGGLSNLRFAIGKPVILLTCATQVGLQIWTPPELTTEVRMVATDVSSRYSAGPETAIHPIAAPLTKGLIEGVACEPCMWRLEHIKKATKNVAPASLAPCPAGRSLRDVPAETVVEALKGAVIAV